MTTKVMQAGKEVRAFSQEQRGCQCPTCLGKKTVRIHGEDRKCFDCRGTGRVSAGGYATK